MIITKQNVNINFNNENNDIIHQNWEKREL